MNIVLIAIFVVAILLLLAHGPRPPPPPLVTAAQKAEWCAKEAVAAAEARREEIAAPKILVDLAAETDRFIRTHQWDALLAVGNAYVNGSYPLFKPNVSVALVVYRAATSCPDPTVVAEARASIAAVFARSWDPVDSGAGDIPTCFADAVVREVPEAIRHHAVQVRASPVAQATVRVRATHVAQPTPPHRPPPPRLIVGNDAQNVHDHGVSAWARKRVEELTREPTSTLEDIDAAFDGTPLDPKIRARSAWVLHELTENTHSSFGMSERDIARAVFDEIQNIPEDDVRANTVETYAKQLADAVENGSVVCSTGKITRMLSALDGVTQDTAKPMWAVRDELATLAAKVRDEGGDADVFRARAAETYVETLGMSPTVLEPLVDTIATGFD